MSDERSAFETTRARLEDIVSQVRRRDVTLEQSLDLLDEAVRLVNECNDLIDQTSFRATAADEGAPAGSEGEATAPDSPGADDADTAEAPFDGGIDKTTDVEGEPVADTQETPDDARE